MSKIIFRGVSIRFIDLRMSEGGIFTRAHLTADFTSTVAQEMGWEDAIPDYLGISNLRGSLVECKNLVLTPNGALAQHELDVECFDVSEFKAIPIVNKEKQTVRWELQFTARSRQKGSAARLEAYWAKVGSDPAAMKVDYARQASMFEEEATSTKATDDAKQIPLGEVASKAEMERSKAKAAAKK